MKIITSKNQENCIKMLNEIRKVTDDMNYKAYGEDKEKWVENMEILANNIVDIAEIIGGDKGIIKIFNLLQEEIAEKLIKEQNK